MKRPLCIDLFCGLGGWTEGFLAEGYSVVGFDIERHVYGDQRYPADLVLQDVNTLHGSQFRDAAVIVASPPCQAYSYRAMPWKRAKALPPPDNTLFEACFRIAAEAGVPIVVENVRGAQPWVGRANWNYGSFYLWGDVPALMPQAKGALKNNLDGTNHGQGSWFKIADSKNRGVKVPSDAGRRTDVGTGARFTSRDCGLEGVKGMSGLRGMSHPKGGARDLGGPNDPRRFNSRSNARKAASAVIAKIPFPLAQHIAQCFKPDSREECVA